MDPLLLADHLKRLNGAEDNGWYMTVIQSIADLTPEQALWRPSPDFPCIWELAAHIHYWTARMTDVFEAIHRGEDPPARSETDWPPVPDTPDNASWSSLQTELARAMAKLSDVVKSLRPEQLLSPTQGANSPSVLYEIHGLLAHTSYHTGQILLLRRLQGTWSR
nr:hypothetical protein [Bacillota bacterium]